MEDINEISQKISENELELLKIIFKKTITELSNKAVNNYGVIDLKFEFSNSQSNNFGYNQIKNLIEYNALDSFLEKHFMYLGKTEIKLADCVPSYYTIVWDYATYFKNLKSSEKNKDFNINNYTIKK